MKKYNGDICGEMNLQGGDVGVKEVRSFCCRTKFIVCHTLHWVEQPKIQAQGLSATAHSAESVHQKEMPESS